MADIALSLALLEPVQAHSLLTNKLWPWCKAQLLAGTQLQLDVQALEDSKTEKQRKFYHGVILKTIAAQVVVEGRRYPLAVWKEHFRGEYLGAKRVTHTNPLTGRKSRRMVRISTEDLSVRAYARLIERVTAWAVTEHSVVFPEIGDIDQDTGEIIGGPQ